MFADVLYEKSTNIRILPSPEMESLDIIGTILYITVDTNLNTSKCLWKKKEVLIWIAVERRIYNRCELQSYSTNPVKLHTSK